MKETDRLLISGRDPNKNCVDEDGNYIRSEPSSTIRLAHGWKTCKECRENFPIVNFLVLGKARSACSDCRSRIELNWNEP